mgnify:CR=1 FL=1
MNENENLYDMVKHPEAKFGRMGDTLIRKVDGQDAHVNAWEANLIDRYGKDGEEIVKSVGAGSTNPHTGNKEYIAPVIPIFFAAWAGLNMEAGRQQRGSGGWDVRDIWNYSLGNQGLGGWLFGYEGKQKKKDQARQVVADGVANLSNSYDKHMGADGFFAENQEQAFDKISAESTDALQEIGTIRDTQIGKADMASSGTIQYNTEIQTDKVTRDYKMDVNETVNQRRQDQFNFLTDLRKQKNALLTDYQQTMDEAYSGDFDFDKTLTDSLDDWDQEMLNPYDV